MIAPAQELLDRFAEIGASVRPGGEDRLVVRAGARPVPAALVRQLREAKPQVLAALASGREPQAGDAGDSHPARWQQHFINRPIHWEPSGSQSVNRVSAADALRVVRVGGNKLSMDGDDLVLEARAPPPAVVLDLLARRKADIVRLLSPGRDGWSAQDWQDFFDERVEICKLDGLVPREQAEDCAVDWCIAEWLNRNSICSPAGSCFGCGGKEEPVDPLLPFGIGSGGRVWLHSRCQPAWYAGRKAEAISELATKGICFRSKASGTDVNAVEVLKIACVAGIKLGIDGDDLLLEPSAPPPPAVLDLLSRHNADIAALLLSGGAGGPPEDLQDFFKAHGGIVEPAPLLLSDGRRLHRFRADSIPAHSPGLVAQMLIERACLSGAVLVPDGHELIVVEGLQIGQMAKILAPLRKSAGLIITVLRQESRSRAEVRS
jgi:hypothetical protein